MNNNSLNIIEKWLSVIIKHDLIEEIMGDLYEYQDLVQHLPRWKQILFLWFHAFQFIRPSLVKPLTGNFQLNTLGMFKLNIKIALRTIRKNKIIAINSLILLILGTLCFQTIFAWIGNEVEMNQFHSKIDRLHISSVKTNPNASLTALSISTLFQLDYNQFPEIDQVAQVHVYGSNDAKISTKDYDHWGKAFVVDSNFFELFDFPFQAGDPAHIMEDPSHIILTADFSKKIFGNKNPMGQTLEVKCDHIGTYQVAGILEEIPANSSIHFDFVLPRHSKPFWRRIPHDIVLAKEGFELASFNQKIKEMGQPGNERFPENELSLTPLNSVYFDHPFTSSFFSGYGDKGNLFTMLTIASIIFLITLIGFNNLQATQLLSQHKRFGIKQIIGSQKSQLRNEIWVARLLILVFAVMITWFIFELGFPYYKSILGLNLNQNPVRHLLTISVIIFCMVMVSMVVARQQIVRITIADTLSLNNKLFKIPSIQKALTVFQFTLTIALLIATGIIYKQTRFMQEQQLGFEHTNVINIDFFEMQGNYVSDEARDQATKDHQYLKDQLTAQPNILSYSQGDMPISFSNNPTSWRRFDDNFEYSTENMMIVDPNYDELLGLTITEGRFFSDSLDENNQQKVVINEAAKKYWNIKDIHETKLQSNTNGRREFEFDIIGVVQDFHYEHLAKEIKPLVLRYRPYVDDSFLIRIDEPSMQSGLGYLEILFQEVNPRGIFSYSMLSDRIEEQYDSEKRQEAIYLAFTLTALILSSLCLFTYAWHETQRRTKEIGIRKVLGASHQTIFRLLSNGFMRSLTLSFLLAFPLAYYFQVQWMQNYAHRANIGWMLYLQAGLIAVVAALFVTGWQSWKIARSNPVDSLRSE